MENKKEKSMTLEEMISEMLKDAKVVKVPLPARAEEKTEAQKQDKPMPTHPSGVPFLSLNIKHLHFHMDESMTSYNYGYITIKRYTIMKKIFLLFAVIIVLLLAVCSFHIIPTGYTGVKTSFGQIQETTIQSGKLNFCIPFVQSIHKVNNKQQDKQKIENEAAIAKAEADKQVAITNAEAEAQKTSIAAEAQAEANRKLAESLSDTLIEYQKIQKWDGKLPTVSGGNALVSIDPAE